MAYIFNYEDNLAIASGQIDAHLFRSRVFADIPQAFLRNTVQAQREVSVFRFDRSYPHVPLRREHHEMLQKGSLSNNLP